MIRAFEDNEDVQQPEECIWRVAENLELDVRCKDLQCSIEVPLSHLPSKYQGLVKEIMSTVWDEEAEIEREPLQSTNPVVGALQYLSKSLFESSKKKDLYNLKRDRQLLLSSSLLASQSLEVNLKWLLPLPLNLLTERDLTNFYMGDVLKAHSLTIMAAFKTTPYAPESWRTAIPLLTQSIQESLFDALSPSTRPTSKVAFYSTVVTSDSECPYDSRPTWEELTNVNRFGCISALRQLQSFDIDVVVYGIIFRGSRARMQLAWFERPRGRPVCVSANVTEPKQSSPPSDDEGEDLIVYSGSEDGCDPEPPIKEWRFKYPQALASFSGILRRLGTYTSTTFSQKVSEGLTSSLSRIRDGSWESWKWPIEDDDTAPAFVSKVPNQGSEEEELPAPIDLSDASNRSLWEGWLNSGTRSDLHAEVVHVNGQGPPSMSSGPSNSLGLTEEMEGVISTAATSFTNDWKDD